MDNYKGMEREISIKELFWCFVFSWRRIVCLGIVFGILVTGLQYVRDMGNVRKEAVIEKSPEEELTESEREELENIRTLRREVTQYREYFNKSPLMQMDPYNEPNVEVQYRVQSDYVMNYTQDILPDYTVDVLSMYARYIAGGDLRERLIEGAELDISSKDLKEMIGVNREGNMFYVSVAYPDTEKLDIIAETVKELLGGKEAEFQKLGSHKLQFIGQNQYSIVNDSLIEKKNAILTRIATLNVQINQLKSPLTEQQKKVLEQEETRQEEEKQELAHPGIRKRYLVIGAFLGVLLAGIWVVCEVLFAAKLQNSEEIRSMFGECLFGEVQDKDKKKKLFAAIDDKLCSLKNRRRKKLTPEQQMNVACANVAISCKRQNIGSLYVTGSEYENIDVSLVKLLEEKLEKQGIQVKSGENMCYNDISMKQGGEIRNILLVEQAKKSIYDEIFNEIQLVKDQDMNLLGVIVLV